VYEIEFYVTPEGRTPFLDWLERLRDRIGERAIENRLFRVAQGNLGDHKYCQDGVWELRLNTGPGYRIYYGIEGRTVLLLLCAGDKSSQTTDIARAVSYWKRHLEEGK
jgi:putative addiction module killer protein